MPRTKIKKKFANPEGQPALLHLFKPVGPPTYALKDTDYKNVPIDWSKVAIIIPARNEENTVVGVIDVAKRVQPGRLIVVANNSTDRTSEVSRRAGAEVFECPIPGKAEAMVMGVGKLDEGETSIVCFLDADLTGLAPDHLRALVAPFFNRAEQLPNIMPLGTFDRGQKQNEFYWYYLPFLAGQRALLVREFKNATAGTNVTGWEIEATLNAHFRSEKLEFVPMVLDGMFHIPKFEEQGQVRGRWANIKMLAIVALGYIKYPFRKFRRTLRHQYA